MPQCNASSPPTNLLPTDAIADTGATSHYFQLANAPFRDIVPVQQPISVRLPNKATMHNTHEGYLDLPNLPAAAGNVYLFPALQLSLLSFGQLCNTGCIANFQKDTVTVSFRNSILLRGRRN
jgi:hypothetical protein